MAETRTSLTRRQFCSGACQVATGAALATLAAACGGGDSPTSPSGNATMLDVSNGRFTGSSVQVNVAGTALTEASGAVLVESTAGVFLLARTGANSYSAIDAICSHESCTVTGADGATYVCPCHGSRYDRNGQVLAGPARAALRQFPASFSDGIVTIAL